jgi:hypothetical protein
MTTIMITVAEDRFLKLKERAAQLGVAPEELVQASLEEWLNRPEEEFNRSVDYVLKKNAELYRRLA